MDFTLVVSEDVSNNDDLVVGNIKKREQIPLYQINRRLSNSLNYRKTIDIRDDGTDRRNEDRNRKKDQIIFNEKSDDADKKTDNKYEYDRNVDEILDWKRDDGVSNRNRDKFDRIREEKIDKKRDDQDRWEEIWDRKDDIFDRNREEIDRPRYDAMIRKRDGILDRRFEQSEREAYRLENTQDNLDSLHQELRWLTINTDEGIGIGI